MSAAIQASGSNATTAAIASRRSVRRDGVSAARARCSDAAGRRSVTAEVQLLGNVDAAAIYGAL